MKIWLGAFLLLGCREVEPKVIVDAAPSTIDAAPDADPLVTSCATQFGSALTASFGRLDGTVFAVVPPDYQACAMPNKTHLQLQVEMNEDAYRMVVNVLSDQGPPDVFYKEVGAPLAGAPWSEGWHPTEELDYVANLNVHSADFVQTPQDELVPKIMSHLHLGEKVSVYATSGSANSNSAHLVHRNGANHDGAIVIGPDTASPLYLVVRFDEQSF